MNPIYQENLAFENKKASLTSTAVNKAIKAVSNVAKTSQVKVANSVNSLSGGVYSLNGTVRIKVQALYNGAYRDITVPIQVKNGVVLEANNELIAEKLKAIAKKQIIPISETLRQIKRAGIQDYISVEDEFYNKPEMDNMEMLDDGTPYNPNGWTKYNADNDYLMIYKGKGGIEKGFGDIAFIAVDIEDGKEIGTANTIMQAKKIVEEYIDSFYSESSKQAERKIFFVEAGQVEETEKECDYLNNVLVYASTADNAIKLASDYNEGKVDVEEVEFNGKKIAAVVEKQEKKAYKKINQQADLMMDIEADNEEEAEQILKAIKAELDDEAYINDGIYIKLTVYDVDNVFSAEDIITQVLEKNGFNITASKIKALDKQAKEVTISNGGSNANLPNAVESDIISYSKAHLPDDLEAGDVIDISGKKYKVETKIANGQESATEWNLRVIKE